MKKLAVILSVFILLATMASSCQTKNQSINLIDDMGRSIVIDTPPQRIISHVPALTEMLYALNLDNKVVGVDDYSKYPPEAQQKPSVGNYWEPSIEKIVSLDPDIVLTDGHSQNIQQLESLGIEFIVIDPNSIEDIFSSLNLIGQIAGVQDKANTLITNMKQQMDEIMAMVNDAPKLRVFYIIDAKTDPNNPWTVGPGSFIDSLITMAGGENIANKVQSNYAQFSIEQIVRDDPDIIILGNNHGTADINKDELSQFPIWNTLTAVKEGKVFIFNADLANPGPRITQGLHDMVNIIHPELFD